jgi:putative DNA primase/helicase
VKRHTDLLKHLLDGGLKINMGYRRAGDDIAIFIDRCNPAEHVRLVSRVGWHGDSYVLPDESFSPDNAEPVMFYNGDAFTHFLCIQGTIEEWRQNVAAKCVGNSRLVFAVSCAFAGALLRPLGESGGGFHFYGKTSKGKTTALVVAGSVWGGGGKTVSCALGEQQIRGSKRYLRSTMTVSFR